MNDNHDLNFAKQSIENPVLNSINFIIITDFLDYEFEELAFNSGVSDVIHRPFHHGAFNKRIETQLKIIEHERLLKNKLSESYEEIQISRLEVINYLGKAAEYKDNETGMHVVRMAHYSRTIVEEVYTSRAMQ